MQRKKVLVRFTGRCCIPCVMHRLHAYQPTNFRSGAKHCCLSCSFSFGRNLYCIYIYIMFDYFYLCIINIVRILAVGQAGRAFPDGIFTFAELHCKESVCSDPAPSKYSLVPTGATGWFQKAEILERTERI